VIGSGSESALGGGVGSAAESALSKCAVFRSALIVSHHLCRTCKKDLPRTELDDIISPLPSTSNALFSIHAQIPLAHLGITPLGRSPSLLLVSVGMMFPFLPSLSRETHTSCDLIAMSLEQVQLILE
jgi:hypothetical protein